MTSSNKNHESDDLSQVRNMKLLQTTTFEKRKAMVRSKSAITTQKLDINTNSNKLETLEVSSQNTEHKRTSTASASSFPLLEIQKRKVCTTSPQVMHSFAAAPPLLPNVIGSSRINHSKELQRRPTSPPHQPPQNNNQKQQTNVKNKNENNVNDNNEEEEEEKKEENESETENAENNTSKPVNDSTLPPINLSNPNNHRNSRSLLKATTPNRSRLKIKVSLDFNKPESGKSEVELLKEIIIEHNNATNPALSPSSSSLPSPSPSPSLSSLPSIPSSTSSTSLSNASERMNKKRFFHRSKSFVFNNNQNNNADEEQFISSFTSHFENNNNNNLNCSNSLTTNNNINNGKKAAPTIWNQVVKTPILTSSVDNLSVPYNVTPRRAVSPPTSTPILTSLSPPSSYSSSYSPLSSSMPSLTTTTAVTTTSVQRSAKRINDQNNHNSLNTNHKKDKREIYKEHHIYRDDFYDDYKNQKKNQMRKVNNTNTYFNNSHIIKNFNLNYLNEICTLEIYGMTEIDLRKKLENELYCRSYTASYNTEHFQTVCQKLIKFVVSSTPNDPLVNKSYLNYWEAKANYSETTVHRKIDRMIANHSKQFLQEFPVALLQPGNVEGESGVDNIWGLLFQYLPNDYVRNLFQSKFLPSLKGSLSSVVSAMFKLNIQLEHKKNFATASKLILPSNDNQSDNTKDYIELWKDSGVREAYRVLFSHRKDNSSFIMLNAMERIFAENYDVNPSDIQYYNSLFNGVSELQLHESDNIFRLIRMDVLKEKQNKMVSFISARAMVYITSIAHSPKKLSEILDDYTEVVNNFHLRKTPIIVVLLQTEEFFEIASAVDLNSTFNDYDGGTNADLAFDYIVELFQRPDAIHTSKIIVHKCSNGPNSKLISDIIRTLKELSINNYSLQEL